MSRRWERTRPVRTGSVRTGPVRTRPGESAKDGWRRCLQSSSPLLPASYPGSVAQPDFRQGYLFLAIAIVTEVTGSVSLRGALDYPWLYAVVAVAFTTAFGLLTFVLRAGIGIGFAYSIWRASGVCIKAVSSMGHLNE